MAIFMWLGRINIDKVYRLADLKKAQMFLKLGYLFKGDIASCFANVLIMSFLPRTSASAMYKSGFLFLRIKNLGDLLNMFGNDVYNKELLSEI